MNVLLGVRMALAGGRGSLARAALMTVGIAIGVPLILLAMSALPVLQSHTDRLAWHRTTAASAPTEPDHAMWLAVTDRYDGRDIVRVHVAPLALTVLFGAGLATLQSLAMTPPKDWILPSAEYFAGLGGGVLAAFAVSLIALPFMDTATRLDTVRYE